jgi:thymidylate synthase
MVHKINNMNIDEQYLTIAKSILESGTEKNDRTGTGTKSIFSAQVVHDMKTGFPLLTTKKMYWRGIVTELIWFLRGDTNIKYLVDNNCHIWDGDCYKNYCKIAGSVEEPDYDIHVDDPSQNCTRLMSKEEFIDKIKNDKDFSDRFGNLGPVYGAQWRDWGGRPVRSLIEKEIVMGTWVDGIDQIQQAIHTLKTNPDSRRIIVNAWNVGELDNMVLPPCHWAFELYTEELTLEERLCEADKFNELIRNDCLTKTHHPDETEELKLIYRHKWLDSLGVIPKRRLSLKWHQRSCDFFLGVPFNIASYALLLEILSKEVNMVPGTLVGDLTNVHIYNNHIEQMEEQISRDPYEYSYPKLVITNNTTWGNGIDEMLGSVMISDFQVEGYESYPPIKGELSN